MKLPIIPNAWIKVLYVLTDFNSDHSPFIGGGALRDLFLNEPPKDVDIFTGPNDWLRDKLNDLGEVVLENGGTPEGQVPEGQVPDSWEAADDTINRVFKLKHHDGTIYQIIERQDQPTARDMLEWFDFGICRVAWDEKGWIIHNDFIDDMENKTFTVKAARYPNASRMRAERFKERFPDFEFDLSFIEGK